MSKIRISEFREDCIRDIISAAVPHVAATFDMSVDDIMVRTQRPPPADPTSTPQTPAGATLLDFDPECKLAALLPTEMNVYKAPWKETNYLGEVSKVKKKVEGVRPLRQHEVIVTVAFYHPERPTTKILELALLGTNTLADLHDWLYCITYHAPDVVGDEPCCEPFDNLSQCPKFLETVSCFVIQNVVYRDERQTWNSDISALAGVCTERGIDYLEPEVKSMQQTKIEELKIRTDMPYIYVHHTKCVHMVVFTEVRLVKEDDNLNALAYPLLTFQGKIIRRKCNLCNFFNASIVAFGDTLAQSNPCLYCKTCFHHLHYSADGQLLHADFSVFPYVHE